MIRMALAIGIVAAILPLSGRAQGTQMTAAEIRQVLDDCTKGHFEQLSMYLACHTQLLDAWFEKSAGASQEATDTQAISDAMMAAWKAKLGDARAFAVAEFAEEPVRAARLGEIFDRTVATFLPFVDAACEIRAVASRPSAVALYDCRLRQTTYLWFELGRDLPIDGPGT